MAAAPSCKVLNVAEKNDAARELSNIMAGGRSRRREGFSKYNKIYEFDMNIFGKNAHMIMTSVSGHLLALEFVLAYRNWNNCLPEALFTADVQYYCPENSLPIKRTLEKEVRGCQHLILWTDGDREGENIADEIVEVITKVKSRGLSIHRARFSEITPQSVRNACNNLGVLNQRVSNAVKTRKELDLRIGASFTRFQTKLLTRAFPSVLTDQLVSYGPCQFPTLGFVVERYNQIQAFISETFYKIKVTHEVREEKVEFTWQRGRIFHHSICLVLYQLCLDNPTAHVLGTTSRPRSKWRPLPLDTVEMEKLGSRKLRINAKETMRIAEKLYTQGFISYPRTETNIFPDSFDLHSAIQQHAGDPQWGQFAARLLTAGPTPRQGNKTDNAHPPIYPTKYTNSLSGAEKQIYELVVRHFLACCSQDAKGQEMKVEISIADEKFYAQGLAILERNYLDVYPYDKWTGKIIPSYVTGSTFQPMSIEMVEGETTPPPLLQEADLIGLMEKHGIGTDATHAEHIETIKSRNYVGVQPDGGFVPGELGMGLVEGYDSMGYELSKPKLRAELELDLKRICDGEKTKEAVLEETIRKYKEVFLNAKAQANRLKEALSKYFGSSDPAAPEEPEDTGPPILSDSLRKCPHCKQCNLVIKKKRDGGYMLSCLGFPECRTVQFFPKSVLEAVPHESMCLSCQPQPVHKVQLKLKEGSVPPYIPLQLEACTTCDPVLKDDLGFGPLKITAPTEGASSTSSSSGRGGTRSSQGTRCSGGRGRGSRGTGRGTRGTDGGTRGTRGTDRGTRSRRAAARGRGRGDSSHRWDHGDGFFDPPDDGFHGGSFHGSGSSGYGGGSDGGFNGNNPGGGGGGNLHGNQFHDSGVHGFSGSSNNSNFSYTRPPRGRGSAARPPTAGYPPISPMAGRGGGPGAADNPITCTCGEAAITLTVRREDSANIGRQFYKCPHPQGMGCNFFLWADQAAPPQATPTGGHMTLNFNHSSQTAQASSSRQPGFLSTRQREPRGRAKRGGAAASAMGVSMVMCRCEEEAVLRTVQKEGPNKGRQFYTCSKPREQQCQFFEWSDNVPPSSVGHMTSDPHQATTQATSSRQPGFLSTRQQRPRGGTKRGGASAEGVSIVMCQCEREEEAVLRTVQKEGPNKGRQFYTCAKPREQQCQFFEWSDNVPASSVRTFRGGRGRGGGANSWRMSQASTLDEEGVRRKRAPPTCSVCREVGHTKRSCPQLKS